MVNQLRHVQTDDERSVVCPNCFALVAPDRADWFDLIDKIAVCACGQRSIVRYVEDFDNDLDTGSFHLEPEDD